MRFLGALGALVDRRFGGNVVLAVLGRDQFPGLLLRLGAHAGRVGTHVGDEADGAFLAEVHAFIEALGHGHGAPGGEAELPAAFLLELARGEGGDGIAAALFLLDLGDGVRRALEAGEDLLHFVVVLDPELLLVLLEELGLELRRELPFEERGERPELLGLEGLDLLFALADEAQGHGLHAAGGQAAAHLFPEDGADLVAHETVEDAAGLLGVHLVRVDLAGLFDGLEDGLLGDLVEQDAVDLFGLGGLGNDLGHVGGDGLAFAVRVGCDQDAVRLLGGRFELVDDLRLALDLDVLWARSSSRCPRPACSWAGP